MHLYCTEYNTDSYIHTYTYQYVIGTMFINGSRKQRSCDKCQGVMILIRERAIEYCELVILFLF